MIRCLRPVTLTLTCVKKDEPDGEPLSDTGVSGIRKLSEKRLLLGLLYKKNYRKNTVYLDGFFRKYI